LGGGEEGRAGGDEVSPELETCTGILKAEVVDIVAGVGGGLGGCVVIVQNGRSQYFFS
jgi:hypothetical protein